ncbi:MAG: HAD hydrolase-like protein, partial [Intestinibacter sp.]|uniref:HAD hydrolase-like protein n=1 Tax=Intestinibacter sp. TaxID=1965304 RepID=UPI003F18CD95
MSEIIQPQEKTNSIDTLDDIVDKKRLLIFDMDGTLLDSMEFWQNLGRKYLESKGKSPEDDLEDIIESMTLQESASYFKKKYD